MSSSAPAPSSTVTPIHVPIGDQWLFGELHMPERTDGVIVFAHGSGSSRHSPRNQFVARTLEERRLATVLIDLLTPHEEALDRPSGRFRFDIGLLSDRLVAIVDWLRRQRDTASLPLGLFGASTGAAAALIAAAERPREIAAIVSRGGRPDLAGAALHSITAPTLFIVGALDHAVLQMNRDAIAEMSHPAELIIVSGATHLFQEPGAIARVAELAGDWFVRHLVRATAGMASESRR